MDHPRNIPYNNNLEELCKKTKFTRKEIQLMYRSFKQDCPNGYVEEDTFRLIFSHFFPYGKGWFTQLHSPTLNEACSIPDVSLYAHYVFKTFDPNKNGSITFKDFIQCLSLMCRGTLQEKLQWAFKLYDINGDGRITKKELMDIVCSVYALVGRKHHAHLEEKALRDQVDKTFSKMDINKDGVVTLDEFMEICLKDETIVKSLAVFDNVL